MNAKYRGEGWLVGGTYVLTLALKDKALAFKDRRTGTSDSDAQAVSGAFDYPFMRMYWLRIKEEGELDTGFGEDGLVKTFFGEVHQVISQGSRFILACGLDSSDGSSPRVFGVVS